MLKYSFKNILGKDFYFSCIILLCKSQIHCLPYRAMILSTKSRQSQALPPDGGYDAETCRNLLFANYEDIKSLCKEALTATQRGNFAPWNGGENLLIIRPGQIDVEELHDQVLAHLQKDNYHCLRKFKGRSSLKSFLRNVINNLLIDLVRKRTGRCRAKERAAKHGEVGLVIYGHMFVERRTTDETVDILQTSHGISVSPDNVRAIYASLWGRNEKNKVDGDARIGTGEHGEICPVDGQTPEEETIINDQQKHLHRLFSEVLSELTGEERLLVRLRFPLDSAKEPIPTEEIALMTDLTKKQVERKLQRILKRCREKILSLGISFDDLVVTEK